MDHYLAEGEEKKILLTRNNSLQHQHTHTKKNPLSHFVFFHRVLTLTGGAGHVCLLAVTCSPRQTYLLARDGRGRANRFVDAAVDTSVSRRNGCRLYLPDE